MLEVFADGVQVGVSPYGVVVTFVASIPNGAPEQRIVVRLPNLTAKELALILRSRLKELERTSGATIQVTPAQFEQLKVAPEDW